MASEDVILIGAGGGTRELISLIRQAQSSHEAPCQWSIRGILDDNEDITGSEVAGVPVLGTLAKARTFPNSRFLSGIANSRNPGIRLEIARRLAFPADRWATFVHPRATVLSPSEIGPGAILYPNAVVSCNVRIEAHALIYFGSVVHHDSIVGEGSCLCAGVLVAGFVRIGRGCYLGIGCAVRERVTIGDAVLVGAGAVVVGNLPPGQTAVGVPAKPLIRARPGSGGEQHG